MLPADEELCGEAFRPSAAFCRALDNEQEYDSIDAVAMAGDHGEALPGLASTTEVRIRTQQCDALERPVSASWPAAWLRLCMASSSGNPGEADTQSAQQTHAFTWGGVPLPL